jgi:hypothetical protein
MVAPTGPNDVSVRGPLGLLTRRRGDLLRVSRRARYAAYLTRTAIWIPASVIGLLFAPMVVTRRTFGPDWTLHLWAIRQQQWNIEATGHPGLFVSAKPLGALYPLFVYVGSGIYSVGGYLAIVLGDRPVVAYKVLYLAGLCLAYGGFTWLSVQFGLRGWRSQIPGATLVTGTYFITNMVSRGDLGEFVAISSLPFVLASVCRLVMAHRVRHWYRLAVVVGVFVFTGSHNITLLWGSAFVAVMGVLAFVVWGSTWPRSLPLSRLGQVIGLAAVGAGLNAWYLFADLAYGLDTLIAKQNGRLTAPSRLHVHTGLLFSPLRPADHLRYFPSRFGYVRLSFPVLFFAWGFLVGVLVWRRLDSAARRFLVALVALTAAYAWLVIELSPWKKFPHFLYNIQFTYRLDSYVLLTTALIVTGALVWHATACERVRRPTTVLLVAIVVFNVAGATWQVWTAASIHFTPHGPVTTSSSFADEVIGFRSSIPPSWYSIVDFRDTSAPVVAVEAGRNVTVPLTKIRGSSFSGTLAVPDGPAPFTTNITGGARFVRMTGIRAVGRSLDDFVVAVRAADAPATGPVAVTIRPANTAPLRDGAIVTRISLIALLALIAWPTRRILRASRRLRAREDATLTR